MLLYRYRDNFMLQFRLIPLLDKIVSLIKNDNTPYSLKRTQVVLLS